MRHLTLVELADTHGVRLPDALRTDWPVAWRQYSQTYYDAPLLMRYDKLDPSGSYKIRVTYSGDSPKGRMRLEADGKIIHDLFVKLSPVQPASLPKSRSIAPFTRPS